ncbi:hypothetical protein QBC42DRAFT_250478 [Cladorrhinum samala]|uniref:SWIM-type domain-containing protein n=1 Tax=Cladorrhinum samala TaxID=585594 RepID=A0AAV9HS66_9PEZI|nr:hypothetical protein QBC42DRAFT_250478 [Cladorrhinum samala]
MCNQLQTYFYCSCPLRDRSGCPHHLYLRTHNSLIPSVPEPTGFFLRRPYDFQRHTFWEPLSTESFNPCSSAATASNHVDARTQQKETSKHRQCPNTTIVIKKVRGLCGWCQDDHGAGAAAQEAVKTNEGKGGRSEADDEKAE